MVGQCRQMRQTVGTVSAYISEYELSSLFLLCVRPVCAVIIRLIQSVNKCHDSMCPHLNKLPGFCEVHSPFPLTRCQHLLFSHILCNDTCFYAR